MQIPEKKLNNGVMIPMVGFGTWQLDDETICYNAVLDAVKAGYMSIDTAAIYGNEEYVGRAIRDCGVPRDQLFITTKVWNRDQGYDSTLSAFDASMKRLGLDVLDLYLIHWPGTELFVDTWRAMEKLYKDGRIRSIGVSNFLPHHLEELKKNCDVVPAVNQIEVHPYLLQQEAEDYCRTNDILIEAWSPLMNGKTALNDPTIQAIAKAHGKTSAQVILRWHVQEGRRIIPRSTNEQRVRENIALFDFELTADEIAQINELAKSKNERTGPHPDKFFKNW
jgi:diketogulonate reductase-like aldo/keto reductase